MSLLQSVLRWLTKDRIRIAPDEGRLLGLQAGQRIVLDDDLFVITQRLETPGQDRSHQEFVKEFSGLAQSAVRYQLMPIGRVDPASISAEPPCVVNSRDPQHRRCGQTLAIERDETGSIMWLECSS